MLAHDNDNIVQNLSQLRELVYDKLCGYDQLEPGVFPMTERILVRGDQPCGIHFTLSGPRRVRYTAIWETDGNSILFYGPDGERFHKTQLRQAPEFALATPSEPSMPNRD